MRLLIVGPPGAGKGTQAVRLATVLGIAHISTGDLFRANIAESTPLGVEAKRYMDAGELVPDEVTGAMVRDRLGHEDATDGFILDGFPRTVAQASMLDHVLAERRWELDAVLELVVATDVVVGRLLGRGRGDDTEDVIRRRLVVYAESTAPLLDFYCDRVIAVDAVGGVDEIGGRILDALPPAPAADRAG